MTFKLPKESIDKLIAGQTAPPSTGDQMLWNKVDRKEKSANRKEDKADKKMDKANRAEAAGRPKRAERLRKKAAKKRDKADKKRQQAQDIKDRPDYWLRRDEV